MNPQGDNNGGENDSNKKPKISEVNTSIPVNNKGTAHIFYKTRICKKFLEGKCRNGDSCNFAHGSQDLRQPPPNWQEFAKDKKVEKGDDDEKIIHRMRICWNFYNGIECPYGERCSFLHEDPEKFKDDNTAMDMGSATSDTSVPDARQICTHRLAEIQTAAAPITESDSANSSTAVPQQRVKGRGFAKLANKKLIGIYGDWINDVEEEEQL